MIQRQPIEPCGDCAGTGRHYSYHRQPPKSWGPEPVVIDCIPVSCFFCGGLGRVACERTEAEIRDEFAAALS